MTREKGSMPRAYLRMSPDLDHHEDPLAMVQLLCAANRMPQRGRFRSDAQVAKVLGRRRFREAVARGDIVPTATGGWYVDGWDEWQEGDLDVASRMRRLRARRRNGVTAAPDTASVTSDAGVTPTASHQRNDVTTGVRRQASGVATPGTYLERDSARSPSARPQDARSDDRRGTGSSAALRPIGASVTRLAAEMGAT